MTDRLVVEYDSDIEIGDELLDVDAELDAELAEEETASEESTPVELSIKDRTVTLAGRDFVIDEPTIGIVVRIIKVFGGILIHGEKVAVRAVQPLGKADVSNRAALFGALAAFSERDLVALGSACLQFEDDKDGRKWLESIDLKLAPLVKAFFLNLTQSDDLQESFSAFFDGMEMAGSVWGNLTKTLGL